MRQQRHEPFKGIKVYGCHLRAGSGCLVHITLGDAGGSARIHAAGGAHHPAQLGTKRAPTGPARARVSGRLSGKVAAVKANVPWSPIRPNEKIIVMLLSGVLGRGLGGRHGIPRIKDRSKARLELSRHSRISTKRLEPLSNLLRGRGVERLRLARPGVKTLKALIKGPTASAKSPVASAATLLTLTLVPRQG